MLLAGEEPIQRLGSLIADFTRGRTERLAKQYPPQLVRGIVLHRRIDRFTDLHPEVLRSKQRFSSQRRRYAGIIVDILYDHYLSLHWQRYTASSRGAFITDAYRLLQENQHYLPERLHRIAPLMIEQDWLGSYQRIEEIGSVYERLSGRLRQPNSLAGAIDEVRLHYLELEQDFTAFFPDLLTHAVHLDRTIESV